MKHRQRGVTMIGWIFLLVPMAIVVYAGIRVGPDYYGYYKVAQAMELTASELKGNEALSPAAILNPLEKRFDVGYIDQIDAKKDVVVTKGENGWDMTAEYEVERPLFGNLFLLMKFKKTVVIR